LLGIGDGTFGTKVDYPTGLGPNSVATADFNGDDVPDLAVANSNAEGVSVFLGVGDGTFAPKTDYQAGSYPSSVSAGDLNADDRIDLAVANGNSNTVSILLGDGEGGFGIKTDFGVGQDPSDTAIGDYDGDGAPDLAVSDLETSTVSVLIGNGDGTFGVKTDYGVGTFPYGLTAGDVDRDGLTDLVVANVNSRSVHVLLNTGDLAGVSLEGEPVMMRLLLPTPNPVRSTARIAFDLSAPARVDLEVLDVSGRLIRVLAAGAEYPSGGHTLIWDGRNETGRRAAPGTYMMVLRAGTARGRGKIVIAH
jgi:hypothetical protein